MVEVEAHPLLELCLLRARWPMPQGEMAPDPRLDLLRVPDADVPFPVPDDAHKKVVRDLLRVGGFKPAGRNKPCNEYMRAAAGKGYFPTINPVVDWTNAAALHGAIPVSTVDVERTQGALRIGIAPAGTAYVFNRSGQEIDVGGLLCLFDAQGASANAVKDSQRTKTDDSTTETLTICWGTTAAPGRAEAVGQWLLHHWQSLGVEAELTVPEVARP